MPKSHEPRLAWTRMRDGSYRCDIGGHRYEIERGELAPWVLSRDGSPLTGDGGTLAEMKQAAVWEAQKAASMEPVGPDERPAVDLSALVGTQQPWVTVYIPSERGVPGRWYVLHTRLRAAYPCQDQAAAVGECRQRNVE